MSRGGGGVFVPRVVTSHHRRCGLGRGEGGGGKGRAGAVWREDWAKVSSINRRFHADRRACMRSPIVFDVPRVLILTFCPAKYMWH